MIVNLRRFRTYGKATAIATFFALQNLLSLASYAEGSKNLTPDFGTGDGTISNSFIGYLCHDQEGGITANFLNPAATANERLYVYIRDGETVYMGFRRILPTTNFRIGGGTFGDATLNLRENDGTLALTSTLTADAGTTQSSGFTSPQNGVIDSYAEALAGPAAVVGASGYAALSYTNNTGTDQDFYIELSEAAGEESWYDLWDISVYDGTEEKPGRLHSRNWGFSAGSFANQFSDDFLMYVRVPSTVGGTTSGSYVKSLDLGGLQPYTALIYANSTGADIASTTDLNGDGTIDFLDARRTQTGNIGATEYDIFINNPDIDLYPTTELPSVTISDAVFFCNSAGTGGEAVISFETNQTGIIAILIDLNGESGFQSGSTDVIIEQEIDASGGSMVSSVRWDGLDGTGASVPAGTSITIDGRFTSGALHVPVYDPEVNAQGIDMKDVRPATSFDLIYWDDRSETGIGSSPNAQLTGSNSDQHTWADGNALLVNTWSFGFYQVNSQNVTFDYVCDPDGDGLTGTADADSDNDGILDANEGDFYSDADGDNIPLYLDPDINNDGVIDGTDNWVDSNGDGINDNFDKDLDGIPDGLDLDSDNDGIPDIIELGGVDSDNDGRVDDNTDTDGDGIADAFDPDNGGTALVAGDIDGDGVLDIFDLDADGDGIVDGLEAGGTVGADGKISGFADSNGDGMDDDLTVVALSLPDTDADGILDFRDIDSDNDGILDNNEGQSSGSFTSAAGADSNGNGLDDAYDPQASGSLIGSTDTDGDGTADYKDTDSDADGINDVIEGWDADGNGFADWDLVGSNNDVSDETGFNTDTDSDGLWDVFESSSAPLQNTDSADNSDWQDSDDDNDGEPTAGEDANGNGNWTDDFGGGGGTTPDYLFRGDYDNDGINDASDLDDDNDGLLDVTEGAPIPLTYEFIGTIDGDRDRSAPDDINRDFVFGDNYSFRVTFESNTPISIQTTIGDQLNGRTGTVTVDGVSEAISTAAGVFQTVTHTPSSASVYDITIVGFDMTVTSIVITETTNNSTIQFDFGTDASPLADGYIRADETLTQTAATIGPLDSDGDGIPNYLDLDSDNDGIFDAVEARGGTIPAGFNQTTGQFELNDPDNDGLMNGFDSQPNQSGGNSTLSNPDTDGDGISDYKDVDSDGDGITDLVEAQSTSGFIALSGSDTDGDGIDNSFDPSSGGTLITPINTDEVDLQDYRDTDSDNDNVSDLIEGNDADNNGVADVSASGTDTDGDGLDNSFDSDNGGTAAVLQNTDAIDEKDWRDTDDDNDGTLTIDEDANFNGNYADDQTGGQAGSIPDYLFFGDADGDGIPDDVDQDDDNDGIPDSQESNGEAVDPSADADGDGIPNFRDTDIAGSLTASTDSNGDGVFDVFDKDLDGIPDFRDIDADNDGIPDIVEVGGVDADGDGRTDCYNEFYFEAECFAYGGSFTKVTGDAAASRGSYMERATGSQLTPAPTGQEDYMVYTFDICTADTYFVWFLARTASGADDSFWVTASGTTDTIRFNEINAATTDFAWERLYDSDGANPYTITFPAGANTLSVGYREDGTQLDKIFITTAGTTPTGNAQSTINCLDPQDSDGDGIVDHYDLDSDDDGIPDLTEYGGTDTNGDGKLDDLTDSDFDGFADAVDSDNGGTALTALDSDGDGVSDAFDADSDNDGIPDPIDNGGTDTNYDGKVDDAGTDSDNDGLADSVDPDSGGAPINNVDTDGDGLPDSRDLDSDNDGYPDLVEGGGTDRDNDGVVDTMADIDRDGIPDAVDVDQTAGTDADSDGIDDTFDVSFTGGNDTDGDGIDNNFDPDVDGDGLDDASETVPLKQEDTDGDGSKDFRDFDSDNDGLVDAFEFGLTVDASTGAVSGFTDADGDGLNDTQDGIISGVVNGSVAPITPPNTDTSSEPTSAVVADYRDLDSDNDGVVDNIESQTKAAYIALTGNDSDNDGLDDAYDPSNGGTLIVPVDTDGDTTEDIYDDDSDGDGIGDRVEGDNGDRNQFGDWDSNTNDTFDDSGFDTDTDRDGILDIFDTETEAGINGVTGAEAALQDSDLDDIWDFQDDDDDGDGTLTFAEGTSPTQDPAGIIPDYLYDNSDSDGDGVADINDADADNDGLANSAEDGGTGIDPTGDIDNDGLLNFEDTDMDGDGIANTADTNGDGNGTNTTSFVDSNSDGVIDVFDKDLDGVADYRDRDSDNDGISDVIELALTDSGDGTIGTITDLNSNGVEDAYDTACDGSVVSGNGVAEIVTVGLTGSGTAPQNALGADDSGYSLFDNTADELVLDLGQVVLSGASIDVYWATTDLANQMTVDQGLTYTGTFTNPFTSTFVTTGGAPADVETYTLTADARYLRFRLTTLNSGVTGVDAVSWSYTTPCTGGTALTIPDTDSDGTANHLDLDSDQDGVTDLIEAQATTGFITPTLIDTDDDGILDVFDANDDDPSDGQAVAGTAISPINTDGADDPDYLDTDSDNDGIPDVVEAWDSDLDGLAEWDTDGDNDPTDETGYLSDADADGISFVFDTQTGNGTVASLSGTGASLTDRDSDDAADADLATGLDYRDNDDDGDGIATASEDDNSDTNWFNDFTQGGTPIPDYLFFPDKDGDGVLDNVDGDSDNDGIPNSSEYNGTDPFGDDDADGIYNYLDSNYAGFADSNGDGVDDRVDRDRDGVPNFFDLDSDNDGMLDAVEANNGVVPSIGGFDVNTGVFAGTDGNSNGTIDALESAPLTVDDFDSDGLADYLDLDSDNDGVTDLREGPESASYQAPSGTDTDGDGLDDTYDADNGGTPISTIASTDSDGAPDFRDQDSDDDLVEDFIEAFDANKNGFSDLDTDLDGLLSDETGFAVDTDGDGLVDLYDNYSGFGLSNLLGSEVKLQDTDADGTVDFRDTDDDSDAINTLSEDDNSNGSFFDDKTQGGGATPDYLYFNDIDGDGIADGIDRDSDNDGITDLEEPGGVTYDGSDNITNDGPFDDDDGDGIFNFRDSDAANFVDSNNDGIDDRVDYDLDGFPDFFDLDSDNDGIPDAVEANDGVLPTGANDQGQFPGNVADADNDGLADVADGGNVTLFNLPDTDGDGVQDRYDIDSDNDGITDVVEAGGSDGDGDGILDSFGDTDGDGLGIQADSDDGGAAFALTDSDLDGIPNYRASNSDGDAFPDWDEGMDDDEDNDYVDDYATRVALGAPIANTDDLNTNSIPDYLEDDDGDGLANFLDPDNATYYQDTDGDGLVDFFDPDQGGIRYARLGTPDSDGDGTPNVLDGTDTPLPLDWVSFEVSMANGVATLSWETVNEINVSHFEILRSSDGITFEVIGILEANNRADQLNLYGWVDTPPSEGLLYYRLKQIDFDGLYDYSAIRTAQSDQVQIHLDVYPNPATRFISISFDSAIEATYQMIDLSGRVVRQGYLPADKKLHELRIDDLNAGFYQLQVRYGYETKVFKIIKID